VEKTRGDFLTYQLKPKEMLAAVETVKQSVAKDTPAGANSELTRQEGLRLIQAEILIGQVRRLEGNQQDALAAFDRAMSLGPPATSEELKLARAEAAYEKASTLLDEGRVADAAKAARGCRDSAAAAEQLAPAWAAGQSKFGKEAQMRSRPNFASWRCQTILAAAADSADASTAWHDAVELYEPFNESHDVALARADMLIRYFRRPRRAPTEPLPPEIDGVVTASMEDLKRSDDPGSTVQTFDANASYPLVALRRITLHNEYVNWLRQGSSIDLPKMVEIMAATGPMFTPARRAESSDAVVDAVSKAYDVSIANWIALERLVDAQTYETLEPILRGATGAITTYRLYLQRTSGDSPNAGALARNSRLRAQAVELVETGRTKQAFEPLGLLANMGHQLVRRLCPENSDFPTDENCAQLDNAVAAAEAGGASLAKSLAASSPLRGPKKRSATLLWVDQGYALGGRDPVPCFNSDSASSRAVDTVRRPIDGRPDGNAAATSRRCLLQSGRNIFSLNWRGQTWLFESEANRDLFVKENGTKAPQFGGYTVEGVAAGKTISPRLGTSVRGYVVDDRLYLTRRGPPTAELIAKAKEAWHKLKDSLSAAPSKPKP
jgi:hypothetical protein